ncbi:hypothetical protein [Rikenella microfusus]|jgi:hypothetical protein|uniref:hypothetical protein n=1 Tax=Rikenella microfusus TaxID=28139 RepID=UPI00248D80AF|nr:hypothetical protein [Rikenella microfusus]
MDDLEEFESWHEDLMAWERFQDELERIKGENTYDDMPDFEDKSLSLQQETSTQSDAERCNNPVEQ